MAPRQRELPFKNAKYGTRSATRKAKLSITKSVASEIKISSKTSAQKSKKAVIRSPLKPKQLESALPESKPLTLDEEAIQMKDVLSHHVPKSLPGRQKQIHQLNDMLRNCIDSERSVSVYIYGSPGHGKTASLTLLCEYPYVRDNFEIIFINCMSLNNLTDVYREIISRFHKELVLRSKQISIDEVVKSIDSGPKPLLLILDELDMLKSRGDSLFFYSLFELRLKLKTQQIALIGVGNQKNFIDKLPLLKYNNAIMPTLMEFRAYDKSEIKDIFAARLNLVQQNRLVFSEKAVELLAAKAATSGDIRQALFFASGAVKHALQNQSEDETCKIDPFTIMEVFKSASKKDSIDHLGLYPKLIVSCVLRILSEKSDSTKLIVKQVYDTFAKVCHEKNFDELPLRKFIELCLIIEDEGVFSITRQKKDGAAIYLYHKIVMNWSVTELTEELRNQPIFGSILGA